MSIEKYLTRVSVRDFVSEALTNEEIETIKKVVNNSPTSSNSQQFSALLVTDQSIRDFIASKNWNQKHILQSQGFLIFLADRTSNEYLKEISNYKQTEIGVKSDYFRAIVDASIAATYTMTALNEMGFGSTMLGGLTNCGEELSKLLNLPETTFPVIGLTFGRASKLNDVKPKMDKFFIGTYTEEERIKRTKDYIESSSQYFTDRGTTTWDKSTVKFMTSPAMGEGAKFLIKQLEKAK